MPQRIERRRKKWPHYAEWARQEAIAQARRGLREAEPVLEGRVQDPAGIMRVMAVLVDVLHRIIRILTAAKEGKDG